MNVGHCTIIVCIIGTNKSILNFEPHAHGHTNTHGKCGIPADRNSRPFNTRRRQRQQMTVRDNRMFETQKESWRQRQEGGKNRNESCEEAYIQEFLFAPWQSSFQQKDLHQLETLLPGNQHTHTHRSLSSPSTSFDPKGKAA